MYCGNNAKDPDLKINGGSKQFGTPQLCFRKGYAKGFNQDVNNTFLRKWSGEYQPYIVQYIYYGSNETPPGYQKATLVQHMQRGFVIGSKARAKRAMRHFTRSDHTDDKHNNEHRYPSTETASQNRDHTSSH